MKQYVNHRFAIVEDDEMPVSTSNSTTYVCAILLFLAAALLAATILFVSQAQAKAQARSYGQNLQTQLCNLMEFNGSTYQCEE